MKNLNRVIITGGSAGIGKEIMKYFLAKKYQVMCLSRKKPIIKHKNLTFLKIDLSKRNEILKVKKKIINFNPKILFNNAANIGEVGYFEKTNIKNWEKSFFLNLFSSIYLSKICLSKIIINKGIIFFMAGGGAANSFPGFSSYSVAKTGIVRFAENLADENKKKIRTFVISPGTVKTKLYFDAKKAGHKVDENKFLSPKKCTLLIDFLLKDKNSYLNGKYFHAKDNFKNFNKKNTKSIFLLRRLENRNI